MTILKVGQIWVNSYDVELRIDCIEEDVIHWHSLTVNKADKSETSVFYYWIKNTGAVLKSFSLEDWIELL